MEGWVGGLSLSRARIHTQTHTHLLAQTLHPPTLLCKLPKHWFKTSLWIESAWKWKWGLNCASHSNSKHWFISFRMEHAGKRCSECISSPFSLSFSPSYPYRSHTPLHHTRELRRSATKTESPIIINQAAKGLQMIKTTLPLAPAPGWLNTLPTLAQQAATGHNHKTLRSHGHALTNPAACN